jgi:hypothetical protein
MSDRFGLGVILLGPPVTPGRPPPELRFREIEPPTPGALLVANQTGVTATLPIGELLTEGMADRAVAATLSIPPQATVVVPVAPLSARWWSAGPPRPSGHLSPTLTALLVLATRAGPGLRSIARTALWEGYRQPAGRKAGGQLSSLAVVGGSTVLAVHRVTGGAPHRGGAVRPPSATETPAIRRWLLGDAGAGGIRAEHRHSGWMELWLVRASLDLPDAVLGSAPR